MRLLAIDKVFVLYPGDGKQTMGRLSAHEVDIIYVEVLLYIHTICLLLSRKTISVLDTVSGLASSVPKL